MCGNIMDIAFFNSKVLLPPLFYRHKKVNRVDSFEDKSDSDDSESESIHRIVTVRSTQEADPWEKTSE